MGWGTALHFSHPMQPKATGSSRQSGPTLTHPLWVCAISSILQTSLWLPAVPRVFLAAVSSEGRRTTRSLLWL